MNATIFGRCLRPICAISMRHLHLAGIQQTSAKKCSMPNRDSLWCSKKQIWWHTACSVLKSMNQAMSCTGTGLTWQNRWQCIDSCSYELQVSSSARRNGLGKMMMQQLWKIGSSWKMEKLMLTVLKGNTTAVEFYKQLNFVIDETSPSKFQQEVDYEIMSSSLCV